MKANLKGLCRVCDGVIEIGQEVEAIEIPGLDRKRWAHDSCANEISTGLREWDSESEQFVSTTGADEKGLPEFDPIPEETPTAAETPTEPAPEQEAAPAAADEPPDDIPDADPLELDPRVEKGVFTVGVETLEVETPASRKTECKIHVIEASDSNWVSGLDYKREYGDRETITIPLMPSNPSFESRELAISFIVAFLLGEMKKLTDTNSPRFATDLEKFAGRNEIPPARDWSFDSLTIKRDHLPKPLRGRAAQAAKQSQEQGSGDGGAAESVPTAETSPQPEAAPAAKNETPPASSRNVATTNGKATGHAADSELLGALETFVKNSLSRDANIVAAVNTAVDSKVGDLDGKIRQIVDQILTEKLGKLLG